MYSVSLVFRKDTDLNRARSELVAPRDCGSRVQHERHHEGRQRTRDPARDASIEETVVPQTFGNAQHPDEARNS
jgi:hypothetical protein